MSKARHEYPQSQRVGRAAVVVWNGITFRRYPKSIWWGTRNYYTPSGANRKRGIESLHREVWKAANGPIPDGYHIHHRDENPLNNALANLECVEGLEHNTVVHPFDEARLAVSRANIKRARAHAPKWHRSEEGRAWHRENGKASWEGRSQVEHSCDQCGATFQTHFPTRGRFCSNVCKSAWRRAQKSDHVTRTCERCGTTFEASRYAVTRFCSRACSSIHVAETRKPRQRVQQ